MFTLIFFFNDTATTEIYTLSLHDALPLPGRGEGLRAGGSMIGQVVGQARPPIAAAHLRKDAWWALPLTVVVVLTAFVVYSRSEEHTSELQSQSNLVCRLLLAKKKRF